LPSSLLLTGNHPLLDHFLLKRQESFFAPFLQFFIVNRCCQAFAPPIQIRVAARNLKKTVLSEKGASGSTSNASRLCLYHREKPQENDGELYSVMALLEG
jgi:hypothetical protein